MLAGKCSVFIGRISGISELSFRTQRQRSEETEACNLRAVLSSMALCVCRGLRFFVAALLRMTAGQDDSRFPHQH